jgi:hypothetical protein
MTGQAAVTKIRVISAVFFILLVPNLLIPSALTPLHRTSLPPRSRRKDALVPNTTLRMWNSAVFDEVARTDAHCSL